MARRSSWTGPLVAGGVAALALTVGGVAMAAQRSTGTPGERATSGQGSAASSGDSGGAAQTSGGRRGWSEEPVETSGGRRRESLQDGAHRLAGSGAASGLDLLGGLRAAAEKVLGRPTLPGTGKVPAVDASLVGERVVVAFVPVQLTLGLRQRDVSGIAPLIPALYGWPHQGTGAGYDPQWGSEVLDPRAAWHGGRIPRGETRGSIELADPDHEFPFDAVELYAARLRGRPLLTGGKLRRVSGEDVIVYGAFSKALRDEVRALAEPSGRFDTVARRIAAFVSDGSADAETRAARRRWLHDARGTMVAVDSSVIRNALGDNCCERNTCPNGRSYGLPCQAVFGWTKVFPVITDSAASLVGGGK